MTTAGSNHIDIGVLFESARLEAKLDVPAQSHLEACDHCRGRLSWMKTASAMGRELEHEPPQSIMDSVLRIGRGPSRLKQLRNFIMASLTPPTFTTAPFGARLPNKTDRPPRFECALS